MFNQLVASTALAAIAALSMGPTSTTALVAVAGDQIGHIARHVPGVSSAHHGIAKRKPGSHRNRKRCVPRPSTSSTAPASSDTPQSNTDSSNNNSNNNSGSTDSGSNNSGTNNGGTQYNNNNGGYAGGGKVGLAWAPDITNQWIVNAVSGKVGYLYNWSPWKPDVDMHGIKFAPMLWGNDGEQISNFERLVQPGYADVVLGFNEVNQGDQASMDTETGRALWETHIAPRRNMGYRLGSPSTTSAPSGIVWMREWMGKIQTKPDFICLHWYDVSLQGFKDYVTSFKEFGLPLWITEYACTDFSGRGLGCDVADFTNQATAWMDNESSVEAYFQFGFVGDLHGVSDANRMIDPSGGWLTDLGKSYIN